MNGKENTNKTENEINNLNLELKNLIDKKPSSPEEENGKILNGWVLLGSAFILLILLLLPYICASVFNFFELDKYSYYYDGLGVLVTAISIIGALYAVNKQISSDLEILGKQQKFELDITKHNNDVENLKWQIQNKEDLLKLEKETEENKRISESSLVDNTFFNLFKIYENMLDNKDLTNSLTDLYNSLGTYRNNPKKEQIITKQYYDSFTKTGDFFRFFYRVLKYITENRNKMAEGQFENYIGFVRAITDEKTMALIYYNAFYTKAGEKMRTVLIETKFLGNDDNLIFHSDGRVVSHNFFTSGTLLWQDDLKRLEDIIINEN